MDHPFDRSAADWLISFYGWNTTVDTYLNRPNSNFGQWYECRIKFPSLVRKIKAFYEPFGFDVWVERNKKGNIKTLKCKPNSLQSIIGYAEARKPGSKEKIHHYSHDVPELAQFAKKSTQHNAAVILFDSKLQKFDSYPRFDTFKEHRIATLDFGDYSLDEECLMIALCLILEKLKGLATDDADTTFKNFDIGGKWDFSLWYRENEKERDRSSLPKL